jgi:hypothetical protein
LTEQVNPTDLTSEGLSPLITVRDWVGPRWVETVDGEFGLPAWGVNIGHASDDGDVVLFVATIRKPQFLSFMGRRPGGDALEMVGDTGLFGLLNRTLPKFVGDERDRYIRAVPQFTVDMAKQVRDWPAVRWALEGEAVQLRVFTFAGAWVAVEADLPLVVLGDGVPSERIDLARDLDSPLANAVRTGIDVSELPSQARPLHRAFSPPREPHPDHYRLLRRFER